MPGMSLPMVGSAVRLWVDDERRPPTTEWQWVRTPSRAITLLATSRVSELSLDHDLGGSLTTRPVLLWLCENPDRWPVLVRVHTANPVGRAWLLGMIYRYSPHQGRTRA